MFQSNAEASLETCKQAYKLSANQRETRQICLYELGKWIESILRSAVGEELVHVFVVSELIESR